MKFGTCKLCLEEKELLNKSHIIPNSFFKISLDGEKYLFRTSNKDILEHRENPKKIYTGEFEPGILCKECDNNKIGKFEQYGLKVLHKGFSSKNNFIEKTDVLNPKGFNYSIIKNVDYFKFKIFLLSILWRSSISSRDFFKDVSLGPYKNILRKMINDEDPLESKDFPILVYMPHDKKLNLKSLIGQPLKIKFENKTSYVFVLNGLIFIYLITSEVIDPGILDFTINKKNQFRISHLPEGKSRDYILRFIKVKWKPLLSVKYAFDREGFVIPRLGVECLLRTKRSPR